MPLKIETISSNLDQIKDRCLVIAFFEDKLKINKEINKLDTSINNIISISIKNKDFKAEYNEVKTFYLNNNIRYLTLLGLGKEKDLTLNKLMDIMGNLSKKLRKLLGNPKEDPHGKPIPLA